MRRRLTNLAVPFALCALMLSACGDDGNDTAAPATDETSDASAAPSDGSGDCPTDVSVGVLPLADYAAVYWAAEKGQFEEEGLTTELVPLQGGPIGVQKVASGELEFSFSNAVSSTVAVSKGAPIVTVALTSSLGNGSNVVFVKPDSPIQDLEDLDGKSVGVNTVGNIGDTALNNLILESGSDVKPSYVEVPFPEIAAGVESGSLDAGYLPEPFVAAAKEAGLRQVVDLTQGPNRELPAATFVTSKAYVQECPENVAAFQRAVNAASEEIAANEEEFREFLPTISPIPPEAAQVVLLPVFETSISEEKLQRTADVLIKLGLVPDGYDAGESVFVADQ